MLLCQLFFIIFIFCMSEIEIEDTTEKKSLQMNHV